MDADGMLLSPTARRAASPAHAQHKEDEEEQEETSEDEDEQQVRSGRGWHDGTQGEAMSWHVMSGHADVMRMCHVIECHGMSRHVICDGCDAM